MGGWAVGEGADGPSPLRAQKEKQKEKAHELKHEHEVTKHEVASSAAPRGHEIASSATAAASRAKEGEAARAPHTDPPPRQP